MKVGKNVPKQKTDNLAVLLAEELEKIRYLWVVVVFVAMVLVI
jgi:hypothetical protein